MKILFDIYMTIPVMIYIVLIRNDIVYKCRVRLLNNLDISSRNTKFYEQLAYLKGGYLRDVLDLTKWTDKQFFPALFEEDKDQSQSGKVG